MIVDAIILGGGLGKRFCNSLGKNSHLPKQFHTLKNKPIFLYAIESLASLKIFRSFYLVFPQDYLEYAQKIVQDFQDELPGVSIKVVAGGARRQDSSRMGIEALHRDQQPLPDRVILHDACRPFLSQEFLFRIKKAIEDRSYAAWIPGLAVTETLKKVENSLVTTTLNRDEIYRVQTPQVFEFDLIHNLFQKIQNDSELHFTDDASVCEYYGYPVGVFEGDPRNLKVTFDSDWENLQALITKDGEQDACDSASDLTFIA